MEPEIKKEGGSKILLPVSIIISGLLIVGALVYQPGVNKAGKNSLASKTGDPRTATLEIGASPVLGQTEAPVTMIVYGDYQCPFCKDQADKVELRLRKEYVETGKLKIVFKHFPLESIHPYARPSAIAANCAFAQGKFWEYHDELYKNQANLDKINFKTLAGSLGLNTETFSTCLKDPKVNETVTQDLESGIALGIKGTPASFIDNVYVEGAYPYNSFKDIIDGQLAKVKK